jgi:site-specific recombinase XerD
MKSTISGQISDYMNYCKRQKLLSQNSLRAYRIDFQQFLEYLQTAALENETIISITKDVLRLYTSQLLSKYATRTCKRKIACIKAFFNYLEYEDIIEKNPFRKIKVKFMEPQRLPHTMTSNEVEAVLSALYSGKIRKATHPHELDHWRNIACVELLFSSGMRVGELCNLTAGSVDLKAHTVRIIGKGNKERMIYIASEEAIEALRQYEKFRDTRYPDSPFYFITNQGKRYREDAVRKLIHQSTSSVLRRRITPHMFRHTFASLLLGNNVDIKIIQELLGHSSIATTQIYLHFTTGRLKAVLKEFHPRCAMNVMPQYAIG